MISEKFEYDNRPVLKEHSFVKILKREFFQRVDEKASDYSACWSMVQVLDDTRNRVIRTVKVSNWDGSCVIEDIEY